tara:strand:- start:789 stop:1256 length:468 start_codon:yes stop_codon:yes gene_type:complete
MTFKLRNLLQVFLIILLSSCGFKIANQSEAMGFKIGSISTTGDSRVSYRIKNNLLPYSKNDSNRTIDLNIKIKKNKTIKEKNINNEVTKYLVSIKAIVNYGAEENKVFSITKMGDLTVSNQYSQTLNSEKKIIKSLSESVVEDIIEELLERIDDI